MSIVEILRSKNRTTRRDSGGNTGSRRLVRRQRQGEEKTQKEELGC